VSSISVLSVSSCSLPDLNPSVPRLGPKTQSRACARIGAIREKFKTENCHRQRSQVVCSLAQSRILWIIDNVSAHEVIEQIKHLPKAERAQVVKFVVESEASEDIREFERAFAGGHERSESEDDIQRIESAVKAGRKP
jgi:excinuclease UvrABC ATPase subunit